MTRLFLLVVIIINSVYSKNKLSSPYTYTLNGDSIEWPCRSMKKVYSDSGKYTARNVIPLRFQTKGFVAVLAFPRLKSGVPLTLGKINLKFSQSTPEVKPFPNWEFQEEGCSDAIQNAVDLCLDQHDVLWVLDTGIVNTMQVATRKGTPKIWGLNFRTGKLTQVIDLSALTHPRSRLQFIVTETTADGRQYIYVSDSQCPAILVWNLSTNTGLRIPIPSLRFDVLGCSEILYSFLLTRKNKPTILGFTFITGKRMFGIPTHNLQNGNSKDIIDFGCKPGDIVPLGTDNGAVLYFRFKKDSKIYQWDSETCLDMSKVSVVQKSDDECRLCSQVAGGSRRLMWVLKSNFQDFIHGIISSVGASVSIHPLIKNSMVK